MKIFLVSGDGVGAGKSTTARQLGDHTVSLADSMRWELSSQYPDYNWFNKDQAYKANTKVGELGGKSVRQVLIEYGQEKCAIDPDYWVARTAANLDHLTRIAAGGRRVAIDDIRKVREVKYLRARFPDVVHVHVVNPGAVAEPMFENTALAEIADYRIEWKRQA